MAGEWNEDEARRQMGQAVAALVAEKPEAATIKPKIGRPEIPSDKWKDAILEAVSEGTTLVEVCERPGWPSRSTVYRWFVADPGFWNTYRACAREMMADAIAEKAYREAQSATDAPIGTLRWRAACWFAAKMNPDRYGDRVAVRTDEKPAHEMTDGELLAIATGRRAGDAAPEGGEA